MKVFRNKNIFNKIIITLLCIILFSFAIPKASFASDPLGGKLLKPICSLFTALGDGAMSLIEKTVVNNENALLNIDTSSSWWATALVYITAACVAVAGIAIVIATGGGALAIIIGVAKTLIVAGTIAVTAPVTSSVIEGMLPESFYLPVFTVCPEAMFSNSIPLLDVDFFNPQETNGSENKSTAAELRSTVSNWYNILRDISLVALLSVLVYSGIRIVISSTSNEKAKYKQLIVDWLVAICLLFLMQYIMSFANMLNGKFINLIAPLTAAKYNSGYDSSEDYVNYVRTYIGDINTGNNEGTFESTMDTVDDITTENSGSTYNSLFGSNVPGTSNYDASSDITSSNNSSSSSNKSSSSSSTSSETNKQKSTSSHSGGSIDKNSYSDSDISSKIDELDNVQTKPEVFIITDEEKVEKAYEVLVEDLVDDGKIQSEKESPYYYLFLDDNGQPAGEDSTQLVWVADNFLQQARMKLQFLYDKKDTTVSIGWTLIYVVLVIFTVMFLFTYIKRVVYMTFLTIIAPLVALSYPIDKMNDGKAQAFNMWFKEYIFNLLIQPMHLILYTILITSAMDFASKNVLYVVVALAFMMPAEKILRKFFGFEKAFTPGLLAGPAGAALMWNGMNKLLGRGRKGGKGSAGNGSREVAQTNDAPRINSDFDKDQFLFDDEKSIEGDKSVGKYFGDYTSDNTSSILGMNNNKLSGNAWDNSSGSIKYNSRNSLYGNSGIIAANSNTNEPEKINASPKRSIRRAIGLSARYYGRGLKNNAVRGIGNKINNFNPIKTAGKVVTGVAGAATVGAAGLAIGVASGDLSKIAQYTATGAIGGYQLTKGIPGKIDDLTPDDVSQVASVGYYGSEDEYNKVKQQEYIKKYQKDERNLLELESRYGKNEAKRIMKEDVPTFLDNGVSNIKEIASIEKAIKDSESNINSVNEGIAVSKYASRIGSDTTKMTAKNRDEWRNTFAKEFSKKDKFKGYDHAKMAEEVMKKVDSYNKSIKK